MGARDATSTSTPRRSTTSANSSWSTGALNPGAGQSWTWNNANPLDRVYVPGLTPGGALAKLT